MKHYRTQKVWTHLLILAAALAVGGCGISVDKRVERARSTMENGDYRAAMTDLKTALEREPANAEARALLAEVSAWFGDYESADKEVERALQFMRACGTDPEELRTVEFYAAHEGLVLPYESALTRIDSRTGKPYATSGHYVWIGERTRDLQGAHVEYFSRISNPIGIKLGPTTAPDQALAYLDRLDPDREPGRLSFIVRMGAGQVREKLPALVEKVRGEGHEVAWICDPMHGNTFEAPSGHKTRRFDDVLDEVKGFFEVHHGLGSHPGGIHVELTGEDVTECVGGGEEIAFDALHQRYETLCDPRLNRSQSLDLAFLVAEMLRARR